MKEALPRIAPFILYIAGLAFQDQLESGLRSYGWDIRWAYPMRITPVALVLALGWARYAELRPGCGVFAVTEKWGWALAVGALVFLLWIVPWTYPMTLGVGGKAGFDPASQGELDAGWFLLRIAGSALLVPVMEELFWRSFIMRWLDHGDFMRVDPKAASNRALGISSVLFALEHNQLAAGFLAGIAYGWLYRKTGTLSAPLLAHAATNGLLGIWMAYWMDWRYW